MTLKLYQIKQIEAVSKTQKNAISFAQAALKLGGVSQKIHAATRDILQTDQADYYGDSRGLRDLRFALVDTYNKRYNVALTLSNVMVSHGCIGAFATLCARFLKPGDSVLLPSPTYPAYANTITSFHGKPERVHAYDKSNGAWFFNIEKIKQALHAGIKMVVLSNPSNPLGCVLLQKQIVELVVLTKKHNCLLVIDEAYEEYVFDGPFYSAINLILDNPHVIRLGTFSKNFAMSGWRVGHVLAHDDIVSTLVGYQDALISCPSMPAQYAALAALSYPELVGQARNQIKKNRNLIAKKLQILADKNIIEPFALPAAGFSFFIKLKNCTDTTKFAHDLLHAKQVAIVPGSDFDPDFSDYVRICYARNQDHIEEGMKRLIDFCL